jgi:hypothetical protein
LQKKEKRILFFFECNENRSESNFQMANQLTSEVAITCYIGRLPQYGGPTEEDLRLHALALGVVTEPWNKYRVRQDIQRVCREEGRSLTVPPMAVRSIGGLSLTRKRDPAESTSLARSDDKKNGN